MVPRGRYALAWNRVRRSTAQAIITSAALRRRSDSIVHVMRLTAVIGVVLALTLAAAARAEGRLRHRRRRHPLRGARRRLQPVLRHLSQRPAENRGAGHRPCRAGPAGAERRIVGEGGSEAALGHDAAGRRAPARSRHLRRASPPSWKHDLDRAASATPHPGTLPLLHRLSRTEYQNAVRDLLAIDALPKEMDYSLLLPADNISSGFDNIADLLFVSPTAMERYLDAAQKDLAARGGRSGHAADGQYPPPASGAVAGRAGG